MRPTPPPGSSSLDPVHNFSGLVQINGFLCDTIGTTWGAAPHPAKGVALGSQYTMGLGLKKSAGFCVMQ